MLRRLPLLAALLIAASAASAQAPPSREALSRVEEEQRLREEQRDTWKTEAGAAREHIAQLNAQLAELSAAQARGEGSVSDKRLHLAALSVRETELAARAGANRNQLSHLLGALQMFTRDPPPALFVHPRDARDAVRAAILVKALTPELERRAKGFTAEVEEIRRIRREAAGQAEDLFTAESDVAERRARIEALIAEKTLLERSLGGEILIADREIAVLAERARTLRELVRGLPAAPKAAAGPVAAVSLRPPVAGTPVRRFGERDAGGARSEGWAWRPAAGAQVSAPAAGIVEHAGPVAGWGEVVILRLASGHHLVLTGLSATLSRPGQSVAAGQTVGRMANTTPSGVGSAPSELHMEVRRNGDPVDPARFMR